MASYPHVFEYPYSAVDNVPFDMKGNWHKEFFKNDHPIEMCIRDRSYTIPVSFRLSGENNSSSSNEGLKD